MEYTRSVYFKKTSFFSNIGNMEAGRNSRPRNKIRLHHTQQQQVAMTRLSDKLLTGKPFMTKRVMQE